MELVPTGDYAQKLRGRGGRALDSTRDAALQQAVLELLADVGYDRLTIDAVAARAHAGKPTIYRRWPGKAELVVAALDSAKGAPVAPDTGTLRDDLAALARSMTDARDKFGSRLTIGLVNAVARDAELRAVFTEKFLYPRMHVFRTVFERAVSRGEMSKDLDLDLLARLLPALALQQLVVTGEMPTRTFIRQVVEQVICPLATGKEVP